ncbi:MAG: methyltransferase, partial [Defluviitaleaceae bacterium]|nr:methyltransferase [Defluviitaleaceae bacterium]
MDMRKWFGDLLKSKTKKAMPILSFPSAKLLGVSVRELINDSSLQAEGMRRIAEKCDTLASVSLMDLSVEAEAFGAAIKVDDNEVPTVYGSIIKSIGEASELKIPALSQG